MENKETGIALFVGAMLVPFFALMMGLNVAVDTFVFVRVWDWLIVPHFGFAPMVWWCAAGIALLVSLTSHQYVKIAKDDGWKPTAQNFIKSVLILIVAYAVRCIVF